VNQFWGWNVIQGEPTKAEPAMFHPPMADETKLGPDETISRLGEDSRKPGLVTYLPNETTGREGP
jgi:hypothetical protein